MLALLISPIFEVSRGADLLAHRPTLSPTVNHLALVCDCVHLPRAEL